jgi:hypothetical protein
MGQKNKDQIKKQITTEITSQIEIDTKNITKIADDSITKVTAEMIVKTAGSINTNTNNTNEFNFNNSEMGEGGTMDITQDSKVSATINAINKIVTNSESMANLISDIMKEVKSKIEADVKAEQSAKNLAAIKDTEKTDGGIEGIVTDLTNMAADMINAGGTTEVISETEIRTKLKNEFKSRTTTEVDLSHKIDAAIKSVMDLQTSGTCVLNTSSGNKININNTSIGKNLKFKHTQTNTNNTITECLNDLNIGTKLTNELKGSASEKIGAENKLTQTASQKGDSEGKDDKDKQTTSSLSKVFSDAIGLIGTVLGSGMFLIIGGIILFIGLIFFVVHSFAGGGGSDKNVSKKVIDIDEDEDEVGYKKNTIDSEDNEQAGGNIFSGFTNSNTDGNIYLLAIILVIINTLARKSIPLCGVLLIVIFLYFVYKKNPKLFRI